MTFAQTQEVCRHRRDWRYYRELTGSWGRWRAYAEQRTGNVAIDPAFDAGELRPDSTTLSILEVVPRGASAKVVLDRLEVRWKERLCTRTAGYNRN
jgi:hypothetical protein